MKFTDEIIAQLRVWRNNPAGPTKRFIILFYGRSGSGLLRTLLNCHPEVYCDVEIYLHRKALFPKRYLQNRAKIYGKKYYGHKAKLHQLENQCNDADKIRESYFSGVKIIYLRRRNVLRQALSGLIGLQRGKWYDIGENKLQGQKFKISPEELIKLMGHIETYSQKEMELLKGLDYLKISYEDDLLYEEAHQITVDKIFDYLGLNSVPVKTPYVKTSPENLEDIIENYHEIVEAVENSEYAYFLKDFAGRNETATETSK